MGNSIAVTGRRRVKVMKINGETMKLRVPLRASDVTKDHPGHVLLDSEAVKHFGIRAKPLEPQHDLKPKRIYFLVEIPKFTAAADHRHDEQRLPSRRVQSGINMTAKDRLECLMLSRRSASDLSLVRPSGPGLEPGGSGRPSPAPVRVRMRLPKSQVAKIVEESKDEVEITEKIIGIYMRNNNNNNSNVGDRGADVAVVGEKGSGLLRRDEWKSGRACVGNNHKSREKRVSFLPTEGEIHLAVDS